MDPLEDAVLVLAHYKIREVTHIWTHKIGKEDADATLETSPEVGSYPQENIAFYLFWGPSNTPLPTQTPTNKIRGRNVHKITTAL
jgi:hypothetical protein